MNWELPGVAAGNNVTVRANTGVRPVSVTQEVKAILTPIAFLQFTSGGSIGTGWSIQTIDGLGEVDLSDGSVDSSSFEGAVVRGVAGGTFQFDLATIFDAGAQRRETVGSDCTSAALRCSIDTPWSDVT